MAFTKTQDIPRSFMELFYKPAVKKPIKGDNREFPMLAIKRKDGEDKDFLVRYYKRGGSNQLEELKAIYPCIVIQDFQPEIDTSIVFAKNWIEGAVDEIRGLREKIYLPIPVTYRFQVSSVTDYLKDIQAANDWFQQNFTFSGTGFFLFNKQQTALGLAGDVVRYKSEFEEVPRDDFRFEYTYTFELFGFLHAQFKNYFYDENTGEFVNGDPETKTPDGTESFEAMVERLKLSLYASNILGTNKVLQHNFILD